MKVHDITRAAASGEILKERAEQEKQALFSRQKNVGVWGEAVVRIQLRVPYVLSKVHGAQASKSSCFVL